MGAANTCLGRDPATCAKVPKSLALFPTQGGNSSDGTARLDWSRLLEHAIRAWAVYADMSEVAANQFQLRFGSREVYPKNTVRTTLKVERAGLFGVVEIGPETVWVAVQGVSNGHEAAALLDAFLVMDDELGFKIHEGIHSFYQELWPQLEGTIKSLKGTHQLMFTGHSMGAALVSLLSLKCKLEGYSVSEVVAWAAPKYSNGADASQLCKEAPILNIVNEQDPAAKSPPIPHYQRWGAYLMLKEDSSYEWCCSVAPNTANSKLGALSETFGIIGGMMKVWNSHFINHYMKLILPLADTNLDPYLRETVEALAA